MNSNVVKILSEEKTGTGILLRCEYEGNDLDEYNYYIILTCYHVVKGQDNIYFEIVNDDGEIILEEDYEIIHKSKEEVLIQDESGNENDVIAYLIGIKNKHNIEVSHIVQCERAFTKKSKVHTLGYPGVLNKDKTVDNILLNGSIMNVRMMKDNMQAYALENDINWYTDYSEKELLEGFSGAPVYIDVNDKESIIGMNQSVPDIGDGNNPYFLSYLRDEGWLIYGDDDEGNYKIKWIGNKKEDKNDIDKTILVIGGSGAGKSSFIKSFAKHADLIDSSGDGQTTRMDIRYEFLLLCSRPKIKINFMNKESFADKMIQGLHKSIISLFLTKYFYLDDIDLESDLISCIKKIYIPLENIADNLKGKEKCANIEKKLTELLIKIKKFLLIDNILEWELIIAYIDLMKILEELLKDSEKYGFANKLHYIYYFNATKRKELFDKVKEIYILRDEFGSFKESDEDLISSLYHSHALFNLYKCEYEKIDQKQYLGIIYKRKEIFENNNKDIPSIKASEDLEKEIVNLFGNKKGYFSVSELNFLGCEEKINDEILKFVRKNFFYEEYLNPNNYISIFKEKEKTIIHDLYKDIFDIAYKDLTEYITKSKLNIKIKNRRIIELDFNDIDKDIKGFVAMCLKSVNNKSISGLVESIEITDMVCNEYAFLFDELGLNGLRFIDTCGLDHVEKGRNLKRTLQDTFDRIKIKMIEPDAVLYLKKLDSGRPTELENILPLIFEVNPKITLYSAFTGIDILYESWNANVETLIWDDKAKEYYPKAVKYLLSPEGKKDIQKNLKCRKEKKDLIYAVFARNIVAYCAKVYPKDRINPFRTSNKLNIKRLLKSIILREHNSVELIDEKIFQDIINSEEFNLELKKCIINIFERASISNWEVYHHMTIWANAGRINDQNQNDKTLGYWGVYRDLWYRLFDEAYYHVFSVQNEELLNCFTDLKALARIESIIYSIKDDFFGSYINLFNLKLEEHEKSRFRKIFEEMYASGEYKYNPFDENSPKKLEDLTLNKAGAIEYLKEVVNFSKGLTKTFLDRFVDLFKDCLINKVKSENEECIKNFKRINPNIVESLNEIQNTINSFFCHNKDKSNNKAFSEEKIDELIKYFISKSI